MQFTHFLFGFNRSVGLAFTKAKTLIHHRRDQTNLLGAQRQNFLLHAFY